MLAGWGGDACDKPICPNVCSKQGICNGSLGEIPICQCFQVCNSCSLDIKIIYRMFVFCTNKLVSAELNNNHI